MCIRYLGLPCSCRTNIFASRIHTYFNFASRAKALTFKNRSRLCLVSRSFKYSGLVGPGSLRSSVLTPRLRAACSKASLGARRARRTTSGQGSPGAPSVSAFRMGPTRPANTMSFSSRSTPNLFERVTTSRVIFSSTSSEQPATSTSLDKSAWSLSAILTLHHIYIRHFCLTYSRIANVREIHQN